MASPNSIFTELVTTTFRKHRKDITDNVSRNNAFYERMTSKGRKRTEDGGLTITAPLEYAMNGTYQRYSGYDMLNVQASDVLSAAEFAWRQIALNVVASGMELRINNGDAKLINLVKARMKNAIRTFKNCFSADLYSDGTLPNQISGLQALVADAGTGTVGGIDSSAWAFWRSIVQSAVAPLQGGGAITPGSATMESLMLPLWMALTRGDDQPDLILASNDYFTYYEQQQVSMKRYTKDDTASGGFVSLKYKKADVIYDGGSGIPDAHMYFLNTDYMELVVHKDADLTTLEEMSPINQDAVVIPIIWMGNTVITNRSLQGVLKG